jgi:predicted dehydrogenase
MQKEISNMAKTYNIGVIGYGKRANDMFSKSMSNYCKVEGNDKCRIVAVTDIRPESEIRPLLEAQGFGDARLYTDPEEMYANEKLDGLFICTRCSLHTKMAVINAKHGIPVLLEKPVATTEEDIALLEGIRDKMDNKTVVSFPLRVSPIAIKAKEIIDSGILGTISQVQAVNNVPYARGYYHGWYRDTDETGGLFLQKATHDLDLIQYLLGEPKPVMVSATQSHMIFKGDMPFGLTCDKCAKRDTCTESDKNVATYGDRYGSREGWACCYEENASNHDSASIMVQYEGGLHAVYSQNFVARKAAGRRGVRIIGYNATLEFEFNSKCIDIFYHNENRNEHIDMTEQCGTSHGGGDMMMMDFYVKMLGGEKSSTPLSLGILSAKLCLAARKSAEENIFVKID